MKSHEMRAGVDNDADLAEALAEAERLLDAAAQAEEEALAAETALALARDEETYLRGPLAEAERQAQKLETEARTLENLLQSGSGPWPAVLDRIVVAKGYEAALGAALGEDLDASDDDNAPVHWTVTQSGGDPALPAGAAPLTNWVSAPAALYRRLAQIGLVSRAEGPALRQHLKAGQRLVSVEGDLWRWDGFTQGAEAPTAAARRLSEKNRLGDLKIEAQAARERVDELEIKAEAAQAAAIAAAEADQRARQATQADPKGARGGARQRRGRRAPPGASRIKAREP